MRGAHHREQRLASRVPECLQLRRRLVRQRAQPLLGKEQGRLGPGQRVATQVQVRHQVLGEEGVGQRRALHQPVCESEQLAQRLFGTDFGHPSKRARADGQGLLGRVALRAKHRRRDLVLGRVDARGLTRHATLRVLVALVGLGKELRFRLLLTLTLTVRRAGPLALGRHVERRVDAVQVVRAVAPITQDQLATRAALEAKVVVRVLGLVSRRRGRQAGGGGGAATLARRRFAATVPCRCCDGEHAARQHARWSGAHAGRTRRGAVAVLGGARGLDRERNGWCHAHPGWLSRRSHRHR